MPFWLLRPRYQLFPVAALPHLPIANLVDGVDGRHRSIISEAHEILMQGVEASGKSERRAPPGRYHSGGPYMPCA